MFRSTELPLTVILQPMTPVSLRLRVKRVVLKLAQPKIVGGGSAIAGHLNIVDNVTLTGMSMVTNNISVAGTYSSGIGLFENQKWKRTVVRLRQLADVPLTQLVKKLDHMQAQIESLESTIKLRK